MKAHFKNHRTGKSPKLSKRSGENSGRFGWFRKRSFIVIAATAAIVACTPGAAGIGSADTLEAYGIDPAIVRQFMENGGKLPSGYEAKLEMLTESQAFADLVAGSGAYTRTDDNNFTMPEGAVQGISDIEVLIRVAADLGILSDDAQQAFVMASVQPTPAAPAVVVALTPTDDRSNDFFDSATALARPSNTSSGSSAGEDSSKDTPVVSITGPPTPAAPAVVTALTQADDGGNDFFDSASALARPSNTSSGSSAGEDSSKDTPEVGITGQPTATAPAVIVALTAANDGGNDFFDSTSVLARPSNTSSGSSAGVDSFNDPPAIRITGQLPAVNSPGISRNADGTNEVPGGESRTPGIVSTGIGNGDPADDDQQNGNSGKSGNSANNGNGNSQRDNEPTDGSDENDSQSNGNSGKNSNSGNGNSQDVDQSTDESVEDDSQSSGNSGNSGNSDNNGNGNGQDVDESTDESVEDDSQSSGNSGNSGDNGNGNSQDVDESTDEPDEEGPQSNDTSQDDTENTDVPADDESQPDSNSGNSGNGNSLDDTENTDVPVEDDSQSNGNSGNSGNGGGKGKNK